MIYAVYRVFYTDPWLIQASIRSILGVVDKVFVCWDDRPWVDVGEVFYKGQKITVPGKDLANRALKAVEELEHEKIYTIYSHVDSPVNQFTTLVNDKVLQYPGIERPDRILIMEHDMVWRRDYFDIARKYLETVEEACVITPQIEVWRPPRANRWWRVPPRPYRTGAVFWDLEKTEGKLPPTRHQGEPADVSEYRAQSGPVHNFGFSSSKETMYWKHIIALGLSNWIQDSSPNPTWYEEKWLNWEPGIQDLEISEGFEHLIPDVLPYESVDLPLIDAPIRERS